MAVKDELSPIVVNAWLPRKPLPGEDDEAPDKKSIDQILRGIPYRLVNSAPKKKIVELKAALEEAMAAAKPEEDINARLAKLVKSSKVVLFMKGDRGEPRCGFSRKVVEVLNDTGVEYSTFDILQDEDVRQGLKTFSNWPTYPQLYAGGELLGGCDIVLEMAAGGELKAALGA